VIEKTISGGQTGADRAALDFAIEHGIPQCGWCPKAGWPRTVGRLDMYWLIGVGRTRCVERSSALISSMNR
jgi:hypothetical protein